MKTIVLISVYDPRSDEGGVVTKVIDSDNTDNTQAIASEVNNLVKEGFVINDVETLGKEGLEDDE
jgi:hypothetical protein